MGSKMEYEYAKYFTVLASDVSYVEHAAMFAPTLPHRSASAKTVFLDVFGCFASFRWQDVALAKSPAVFTRAETKDTTAWIRRSEVRLQDLTQSTLRCSQPERKGSARARPAPLWSFSAALL